MNVKYSPTPESLVNLFRRRGIVSLFVEFMPADSQLDRHLFGEALDDGECPVLRILSTASAPSCWMTTKRLFWDTAGSQCEILLSEVFDAVPYDFVQVPVAQSKGLAVEMKDGRKFELAFPDPGIVNGMWGILDRYARRNGATAV